MKRVINIGFLVCFSSGMAADFRTLERQRRADEAELVAAGRRLEQLNLHADPSAVVVAAIREADVWSGRNVEYRAGLLKDAYARFNTPGIPKNIVGTNLAFLGSLILAEVPKLPADRAMMTMNGLWNTLTAPVPEESAEDWEARRRQNLELWLKTAEAAAAQFKPELANSVPHNSVSPPPGSALRGSGADPEYEPNPEIREKYYEMTYQNLMAGIEVNRAHEIGLSLPKFEQRAESLVVMLYSRPPYALDELQEILDRRVSDERGSNIMNAVYRALPKAIAAGMPRPIPHAKKAKSDSQGGAAPGPSGLPAIARPSKLREGMTARGNQGSGAASPSGVVAVGSQPAGSAAGSAGGQPGWVWALLSLGCAAGGWVWLRQRQRSG